MEEKPHCKEKKTRKKALSSWKKTVFIINERQWKVPKMKRAYALMNLLQVYFLKKRKKSKVQYLRIFEIDKSNDQ